MKELIIDNVELKMNKYNLYINFQIGILKSLHAKNLLSEEQLRRCIELLIEKNKQFYKTEGAL